ncbi:MAG: 50S ribosomal protein L16 [Candidatus Bathyarchaeota archaeon]
MPKHYGGMAYTRKKYIRSMPQSMIKRFTLGDTKAEFSDATFLKAAYPSQVGSGALEAARVTANKVLEASGKPFLLKILPFPHEVVREHKFMGFAGADRLSRGMTKSFGRPASRRAKLTAGQVILAISVNSDMVATAKAALKRASKKLPIPCNIVVEEEKLVEIQETALESEQ